MPDIDARPVAHLGRKPQALDLDIAVEQHVADARRRGIQDAGTLFPFFFLGPRERVPDHRRGAGDVGDDLADRERRADGDDNRALVDLEERAGR